MSVAVKPEERLAPTCECRPQCWQRLTGEAHRLWKVWDIVHKPRASSPDERNWSVALVIAGHEDGLPVVERGEGWSIISVQEDLKGVAS